jgi:hypothetical protein
MKLPTFSQILGITPSTPEKEQPTFDPKQLGEKKILLTWQAPSRPHLEGRSQKFNRTFLIIGIVIGLLLIAMQEYVLILLVASIIFISNVLSKSVPENVKIELSTHGLAYDSQMYYWHQLKQFFFTESNGSSILNIDTFEVFPGRLFVLFNAEDRDKIREIMEEHITFLENEPKNIFDKTFESVVGKLNLDR